MEFQNLPNLSGHRESGAPTEQYNSGLLGAPIVPRESPSRIRFLSRDRSWSVRYHKKIRKRSFLTRYQKRPCN